MVFLEKIKYTKKKKLSGNFYFCFLNNFLYFNISTIWWRITLKNNFIFFFFKQTEKIKYVLLNFIIYNFFTNIFSLQKKNYGFFIQLKLVGLGYKILKITNFLFKFFWNFAIYIYVFIPNDIFVQSNFLEKSICLFGLNLNRLNNFFSFLLLLKVCSKYRILGFVIPSKIYRLKIGKKR